MYGSLFLTCVLVNAIKLFLHYEKPPDFFLLVLPCDTERHDYTCCNRSRGPRVCRDDVKFSLLCPCDLLTVSPNLDILCAEIASHNSEGLWVCCAYSCWHVTCEVKVFSCYTKVCLCDAITHACNCKLLGERLWTLCVALVLDWNVMYLLVSEWNLALTLVWQFSFTCLLIPGWMFTYPVSWDETSPALVRSVNL